MALPRNIEEDAAARRVKRQDKHTPLLIREDGVLMPNVPLIRRLPTMRPYTGDPKATIAERRDWLKGIGKRRAVLYSPAPDEPFDLNKADLDSLLAFALDEFGAVLDPAKPIETLRAEVYRLSQLPAPGNQLTGEATAAPGRLPTGPLDGPGDSDIEGGDVDVRGLGFEQTQQQANAGQPAHAGMGNTAGRRRRAA